MPGKHRKSQRRRLAAKRGRVSSVAAAAVTATSLTTALTTGATVTVASPAVELTALITPANSTAQVFAGSEYYKYNWAPYGSPQVVPFFVGPQGIANAIHDADGEPIAVLSSGWGAGQTGTALTILKARNDSAINDINLVVLDNNTNRAGGGFWTTYSMFAPLLLTSGKPTPSNTGIPVLDVGYDYNINGNAPTYPINLLADANALVAYVLDYGGQATAPVPESIINEAKNADPSVTHYHYILDEKGNQIDKIELPKGTTTTYVTFKSEHLPLVQPLRLIPGGAIVADAIEPTLTVLVNAGYKDNQPIPQDPTVVRRAGLFPSVSETSDTVAALPGAVRQGITNMRDDVAPDSAAPIVTQTSPDALAVNALTANSHTPTSVLREVKPTSNNAFDVPSVVKPGANKPSGPSPTGTQNPLRQAINDFRSDLHDAVHDLTGGAKKPSDTPAGSTATANN